MSSTRFEEVLKWPLAQIEDWFSALLLGGAVGDSGFNWLLFASVAGSKAQKEKSLRWVRLALDTYGEIAARAPSPERASEFVFSAMLLRVWFIERLGAREDDLILNPLVVLDWFNEWLGRSGFVSHAEVAELVAAGWQSLPVEMFSPLRSLRIRLNVVARLVEAGAVGIDSVSSDWLRLRDKLP